MKKQLISLLLIAAMVLTLCACGHQHTWVEATCTEPKTCSECGETEGEPLGHQFSEATYWEAPTCSVCGAVEGEPLTPAFEAQGFTATDIEDVPAPQVSMASGVSGLFYRTCASGIPEEEVFGYIRLKDQQSFTSDETHPAKDGYEWHTAAFEFLFIQPYDSSTGEYGLQHGFSVRWFLGSYYTGDAVEGKETSGHSTEAEYTVYWQGNEYPECFYASSWDLSNASLHLIPFEDDPSTFLTGASADLNIELLVPVGYDGAVLGFYNAGTDKDPKSLLNYADDDTVFIRFDK